MSRHILRPRRLRKFYQLLSDTGSYLRASRYFPFACIILGAVLGYRFSAYHRHSHILLARSSSRPRVFASASASLPSPLLTVLPVVLLSSVYSTDSSERDDERARTAARNSALRSVASMHFLHDSADEDAAELVRGAVTGVTDSATVIFEKLREGEEVSYRALFEYANTNLAGRVVVLHNSDIYFDESVACAGLLRPERKLVLALSRHPSPDCVAASGHDETGWSAQDLCEAYHVVHQASHDAFAFVPPVPENFLEDIGDLPVNRLGAENIVLWNLQRLGLGTINPCGNIHAFHAHCDAGTRAGQARAASGNEGEKRKQFGATKEFGFIDVERWSGGDGKGLDCLLYGLSMARRSNDTL